SKPPQALVHFRQDGLARQPTPVRTRPDRSPHFGGENDLVALREVADGAAQHLFALAGRIHVGGIEEVDARFERPLEVRASILFAQRPRPLQDSGRLGLPVAHTSEAHTRNLQARAPQRHVLHGDYFLVGVRWSATIRPPLMVTSALVRSLMSASGLPSISTRSATFPGSSVPISCRNADRAAPSPMILLMSRGENTRLKARSSSASDTFGAHVVSVP